MGRKRRDKKGFVSPKEDSAVQPELIAPRVEPPVRTAEKRRWSLSTLMALLIIGVSGMAAFWSGLFSPFMDDDGAQINNNPVVQSIVHIPLLFAGGTFYNGGGMAPLSGIY